MRHMDVQTGEMYILLKANIWVMYGTAITCRFNRSDSLADLPWLTRDLVSLSSDSCSSLSHQGNFDSFSLITVERIGLPALPRRSNTGVYTVHVYRQPEVTMDMLMKGKGGTRRLTLARIALFLTLSRVLRLRLAVGRHEGSRFPNSHAQVRRDVAIRSGG